MTAPQPVSVPKTKSLDHYECLKSIVRIWLVERDAALWSFVSGVNEALEEIKLEDAAKHAEEMNALRQKALRYAQLVDSKRQPESIISTAINELLQNESPKFLLRTDSIETAF